MKIIEHSCVYDITSPKQIIQKELGRIKTITGKYFRFKNLIQVLTKLPTRVEKLQKNYWSISFFKSIQV